MTTPEEKLATHTSEMLAASASVIQRRLQIMATPLWLVPGPQQTEMQRMVREKSEATLESVDAMNRKSWSATIQFWERSVEVVAAYNAALAKLWLDPTPGAFITHQGQALSRQIERPGKVAQGMARAATEVAEEGLAPIHRRATANAKRLAR